MRKVSIIVPVYNEEGNIQRCYDAVVGVMEKLKGYEFEIFFSDNKSTDKSWFLIKQLAVTDPRVRGVSYSKNFGFQRSIYQAHLACGGDAAITLDCDLQDNPVYIPEFVAQWEQGCEIVFGVRKKRPESFLMESTRKFFYRLVNYLSEEDLPHDVGEFRLIDRKIIEHLREYNDHQPYLRGIIASLGYRQGKVFYEREVRTWGETKFNLNELFKVAFDGIFNFSIVPLRIAFYVGIFSSVCAVLVAMAFIVLKLFFHEEWPAGFTTITVLVLLGTGLNGIFLGILGEYIGRIYKQLKAEPIAIIEERI